MSSSTPVPLGVNGRIPLITPAGNVIVGQSYGPGYIHGVTTDIQYQPFRWEDGNVIHLGYADPAAATEPRIHTTAISISRDGSVMLGVESYGHSSQGGSFEYPTLWTESDSVRKLTDVLQDDYGFDLSELELDPTFAGGFTANYMSPDGVVVGDGVLAGTNERVGWYAVVIPKNELTVNDIRDLEDATLSDEVCDVDEITPNKQCTLRAAIQTAEIVAGPDSISFDIDGAGVHTIKLTHSLSVITDELVIDATTEEDYESIPLIQLRGSGS